MSKQLQDLMDNYGWTKESDENYNYAVFKVIHQLVEEVIALQAEVERLKAGSSIADDRVV